MDRMLRIECIMRGYYSQFNYLDGDFWRINAIKNLNALQVSTMMKHGQASQLCRGWLKSNLYRQGLSRRKSWDGPLGDAVAVSE